jgi:hypothetical protein
MEHTVPFISFGSTATAGGNANYILKLVVQAAGWQDNVGSGIVFTRHSSLAPWS